MLMTVVGLMMLVMLLAIVATALVAFLGAVLGLFSKRPVCSFVTQALLAVSGMTEETQQVMQFIVVHLVLVLERRMVLVQGLVDGPCLVPHAGRWETVVKKGVEFEGHEVKERSHVTNVFYRAPTLVRDRQEVFAPTLVRENQNIFKCLPQTKVFMKTHLERSVEVEATCTSGSTKLLERILTRPVRISRVFLLLHESPLAVVHHLVLVLGSCLRAGCAGVCVLRPACSGEASGDCAGSKDK